MNDEALTKQLGELLNEVKRLNEEKIFLIDTLNSVCSETKLELKSKWKIIDHTPKQ